MTSIEGQHKVDNTFNSSRTTTTAATPTATATNNNDDNNQNNNEENPETATNNDNNDQHRQDTKTTIAAALCNTLEWYDFSVFGYLSDIIGQVFFPPNQKNQHASLIESFAVFGAAFLVRPIGGLILGLLGDTNGRKEALETSVFLMAGPTVLLGCLPSFEVASWASPVLLLLVRLMQGFSVGGQLTSTLVFTMERAPENKWGRLGASVFAFSGVGTAIGSLFSYVLRQTLSDDALVKWGWRVPFWFGAFGVLPALYLKFHAKEDQGGSISSGTAAAAAAGQEQQQQQEEEEEEEEAVDSPGTNHDINNEQNNENNNNNNTEDTNILRESFSKSNFRSLLSVIFVCSFPATTYYVTSVWIAIFMESILNPPVPHAFAIVTAINLLSIPVQFLCGCIADWYGIKSHVMIFCAVSYAWMTPLVLYFISKGSSSVVAFFGSVALSSVGCLWNGAYLPWIVKSFPPSMRLTSVSFAYNLSVGIFGGFSPSVATALTSRFGSTAPGFMITVMSVFALLGLYIAPKKNGNEENDDEELNHGIDQDAGLTEPLLT